VLADRLEPEPAIDRPIGAFSSAFDVVTRVTPRAAAEL